MHSSYLDAIRSFEGFTPQAQWDYAQFTNGYGTRAQFSGEVINRAEADRRFQAAVANARTVVERHAPHVDEGTKAALTSLTYNAGDSWVRSGLGDAVLRGDLEEVRTIFQQYNKAGGEVLPGLVSRRAAEALWIGNPEVAGVAKTDAESISPAPQGAEFKVAVAQSSGAPGGGERGAQSIGITAMSGTEFFAELVSKGVGPDSSQRSAIAALALNDISEVARLMRLEHGHQLLAARSERDKERERADAA